MDSAATWIFTAIVTALGAMFWYFIRYKYEESRAEQTQKHQEILVSIKYIQELQNQILQELAGQSERNLTYTKRLDSHKIDIEKLNHNFNSLENRVIKIETTLNMRD